MLKGGISDPRNKALMKMFNMVAIGERAGSGVPSIFDVWKSQGWIEPTIEERYNPDRIILALEFKKTSDKKQAKTLENINKIYDYLSKHSDSNINDIASELNLSLSRTRAILSNMDNVESTGSRKFRKYRIK